MGTKLFFVSTFASILFFSCTNTPAGSNSDSVTDTAKSKHGITVSDQNDHAPHQVKDSIYNGHHVERYDNGVIYISGDVQAGLRHGTWLTFYKDGKQWSQGDYLNGYREGYGVSWYPNGQKSSEGYYKKDRMVGKWKFWNEEGTLAEKNFGGDTTNLLK